MVEVNNEFPVEGGKAHRSPEKKREEEKAEREKVAESEARLNAPTVYQIIANDGIEEMERPLTSLWWSGVAAGLGISISLYMMAALRVALGDTPGAATLEKFGYCFGFLIVVLGRLQLFTENTITPVLPVLRDCSKKSLYCIGRLWLVVLVANLVGTFLAALMPILFPMASDAQNKAILDISLHFAERAPVDVFFTAIPAGFLVAAMVWMLVSSKGFEVWTIVLMTFAIAVADTSHVVVGSAEIFTVILHGEMSVFAGFGHIVLAGLGNIVGGTGLFAILAYAQVREEI